MFKNEAEAINVIVTSVVEAIAPAMKQYVDKKLDMLGQQLREEMKYGGSGVITEKTRRNVQASAKNNALNVASMIFDTDSMGGDLGLDEAYGNLKKMMPNGVDTNMDLSDMIQSAGAGMGGGAKMDMSDFIKPGIPDDTTLLSGGVSDISIDSILDKEKQITENMINGNIQHMNPVNKLANMNYTDFMNQLDENPLP